MYIYALLLAIGIFGIVAMALTGFIHIGGHAGGGHHIGHTHVHTGHVGHGVGAHGHVPAGARGGGHTPRGGVRGLSLKNLISISPLDVFSYCAGAGLGAFLLRPYLAHKWLPIPAVLGALLFDILITRTVLTAFNRVAADPSRGLEGMIATEGVAATNFDDHGKGLVRLTLDGQIVQLLATLEAPELSAGVRVRKGDSLLVVNVDSVKNTCRVTREFSQEAIDHSVLKLQEKS